MGATEPGPAPEHDDATADLAALVLAVRAEDAEGIAAILANGNVGLMLVSAVKALTVILAEQHVDPDHFRYWLPLALARP